MFTIEIIKKEASLFPHGQYCRRGRSFGGGDSGKYIKVTNTCSFLRLDCQLQNSAKQNIKLAWFHLISYHKS